MKTSKQLYGHMKIHSDHEEPFKCEVCGKVYKSLFYLEGHQRMHEGIKPYKCSICDKSFVMSSQLRRHENTHAGEVIIEYFILHHYQHKIVHIFTH